MKSVTRVLAMMAMAVLLTGQAWAQAKTTNTSREEMFSLVVHLYGDYYFNNVVAQFNSRADQANAKGGEQIQHINSLTAAGLVKVFIDGYRAGDREKVIAAEGVAAELPIKAPTAVKIDLLETLANEYIAGYEKYKVK